MGYTINTFVNNLTRVSLFDDILTVLFLVHSKSNYIPKGMPVAIFNSDDLALYFPDCIEKDNEELQLINNLIGNGYRVVAVNIAETENKETLLVTQKNELSEYENHWYNPLLDLGYLGTKLHGTENLAIKIDLKEIKYNDSSFFFLLEHKIQEQLYPVLIYNGPVQPDIPQQYWTPAHTQSMDITLDWELLPDGEHGTLTDESAEMLAKALLNALAKEQYTCVYDATEKCIYAAFSYPFVDFTTLNNIAIDWAPNFNDMYLLTAIPTSQYVLGIESLYNSDLADIEVDIYKRRNIYYVDVIKTYADSVCNTLESYSGLDVAELVAQINDLSNHVILTNYTDTLPEGKFILKQQNPHAVVTLQNYYDGLEALRNLIYEEELCYYFNIFYEPDIRYLIEDESQKKIEQAKIQDLIRNIFDTTDLANFPIVKLLSYLGEPVTIGTLYYAYFVDDYFVYNEQKVSAKGLFLQFLTNNLLETTVGQEVVLINDLPEELPFFVNTLHENYRNYNTEPLKVLFNEHTFDIKDILLISCFNTLLYSALGDISPSVVRDQQNTIEQYYLKYFNYLPSINIAKYNQDGNMLYLTVEYTTDNLQEVNTIDLVLNLS